MHVFRAAAICVLLLTGAPAFGQPAKSAPIPIPPPAAAIAPLLDPPPLPGVAATTASPPSVAAEAAIDRRIRVLRLRLGITRAQLPLWSTFAHAMREDAQSTDALLAERAAALATMSAIDSMNSYTRMVRIYATNTERLADAFDRLYESLTATQKRATDEIFRHSLTEPHTRR